MNLAIDIGNTNTKVGIFEGQIILKTIIVNKHISQLFDQELKIYKDKIDKAIVCSVIEINKDFNDYLDDNFPFLLFSYSTPVPINNLYHSPLSIGMDRIAAVIGSRVYCNSKNTLVIDAGTCITYDFINANNEYLGGGISPGIMMRFKALNNYTSKLPLVQIIEENNLIGRDTMESIKSGVVNGTIAEVTAIIDQYRWLYDDLKVIITGGDSSFFAINLKNGIFAAPHLVLQGLNEVLIFQTNR
jgi:type III pantothenate kinase